MNTFEENFVTETVIDEKDLQIALEVIQSLVRKEKEDIGFTKEELDKVLYLYNCLSGTDCLRIRS